MIEISRRKVLQGAAGLGLISGIPAFSIGKARAASKTVKLGSVQPLSGPFAAYGQETQPVIEYMVRKINASGGIQRLGGAQIELVTADTGSNSNQASREARRLITQEGVDLIIGALLTADFLAIAGVLNEYKTPAISIFAGGSTTPYGYSVGLTYDEGYAGSMCDGAAFLRDIQGRQIKTALKVNANYEAGQQVSKFLEKRLQDLGIEVVADVPLDVKSQDFLAAMLKIRNAKPDLVIGYQMYPQLIGLMQARYQLKYYDSIFIGSLSNCDLRLRDDLGSEVAGEVLPNGVYGTVYYAPSAKHEPLQKLATELQGPGGVGHKFGQYSIPAAQAVRIIQHALETADTTDKEMVNDAIRKVRIPVGHPDLYYLSAIQFGSNGMLVGNKAMIAEWNQEKIPQPVIVYPKSHAG